MTLKVTDNQYGRLSYRQLGFLFFLLALELFGVSHQKGWEMMWLWWPLSRDVYWRVVLI